MSRALFIGCAALSLAGCESTQSKSERLAKESTGALAAEKGVSVKRQNPDIAIVETTALQDENGAAVVVVLKNKSERKLRNVPISIDVLGKGEKSVFKNDMPGLEDSLTSIAALMPGEEVAWVNDQVVATGAVKTVEVKAGEAEETLPAEPPRVEVGPADFYEDPVSGLEAEGRVRNLSDIDQRLLVLYCVARRGGKVVAAGRGQIERLRAGKGAEYHIFFIGDPRGADLTVIAPPTTLE